MSDHVEFEVGSGNVFADLNMPNPAELQRKARLVFEIDRAIMERGWSDEQAARALGISGVRLQQLLRGRLDRFSIDRLLRFLTALDRDVEIVVRPRATGAPTTGVTS
jgi:predicted XRE-type DNA-binding protein